MTTLSGTIWAIFTILKIPDFLHWGLTPKTSNPHNSGVEVDIDFVPTAFFIVRRVLKGDVVIYHQMAPQVR